MLIQRAWQFLQASIFFSPSPHLLATLWSWLLFIKWRPFIHQQNCYFDAWQSPIFWVDLSLNHCMLLFSFLGSQLGMWMSQFRVQTISSLVCSVTVVSLLTSAAISLDRLLALLLGLIYRHTKTLRRVWVVIVCIWLISALPATCVIFSEYPKLYDISFWLFSSLLTFSLLVSVFSYAKIFKTLRYRQVQVHGNSQQGQRPNGGGNQLNIARYKKTVYSIAWVQLALLICYFPYILIRWLSVKPSYSTEIYILSELFVTLIYLNSSLNPALYCWRIRDVKQEVKNIIRKIFRCF